MLAIIVGLLFVIGIACLFAYILSIFVGYIDSNDIDNFL